MPKSKLVVTILVTVLMAIIAGCGADASPNIVENPTVTPTLTPTLTITPAEVANRLPTSTPVASWTPIPQTTATPGPSPTSPLRPTFTPLPPTQTPTPVPISPTPNIIIESFRSNRSSIAPDSNVTLSWSVIGAENVTIYRLDPQGLRERQWPVDAEGDLTVSANAIQQNEATFQIVASAGSLTVEQNISLEVNCGEGWFFSPPPADCPDSDPVSALGVAQQFEGGQMIWVSNTLEIYIIYNDDRQPQWQVLADTFIEGEPARDDSIVPPEGRLQPVRGFGKVWRENPTVRERLGWATDPETPFDGAYQTSAENTYLRSRDTGILVLTRGGTEWTTLIDQPIPTATPEIGADSE